MLVAALAASSTEAEAALVNFTVGASATAGQESGAAVVGTAGDFWNEFTGGGNTPLPNVSGFSLIESDGTTDSGVDLTITEGGRMGGATFLTNVTPFKGNAYLDNNNANEDLSTFTLSGLVPGSEVDLYLYGSHPDPNKTEGAAFTLNGITKEAVGDGSGAATSLVEGVTYVVFNEVVDSSGEISFDWSAATGTRYTAFAGFQAEITIPEPTTSLLAAFAGIAAVAVRRR